MLSNGEEGRGNTAVAHDRAISRVTPTLVIIARSRGRRRRSRVVRVVLVHEVSLLNCAWNN